MIINSTALIGLVIRKVVISGGDGIHLGITAVGDGMTLGMILGIHPIITAAGAGAGTILGIMVMPVGMILGIIEAIGAGDILITIVP